MAKTAPTDTDPKFMSVTEAAAWLGIKPWQTYKILDARLIDSRYIGRRRLVDIKSLEAYADNLPIYPSGPAA